MRAVIDKLAPKESANSPKVVPKIIDQEAEWFWVKHFEKDKEHGPITRQDFSICLRLEKITVDSLVARDRGESPREFRTLGEEIPALKMLSGNSPRGSHKTD